MVFYKLLEDGAFVCGESRTGMTCYSYPSSDNARLARSVAPELVAATVLAKERRFGLRFEVEYDSRNWKKITGTEGVVQEVMED